MNYLIEKRLLPVIISLGIMLGSIGAASFTAYAEAEVPKGAKNVTELVSNVSGRFDEEQVKPSKTSGITISKVIRSDEAITVYANVENPTPETDNAMLLAAIYKNDMCSQVKVMTNGKAEFAKTDDGELKVFLWSALEGAGALHPLRGAGSADIADVAVTPALIDYSATELSGTNGWNNNNNFGNAFDGNVNTYFDGETNGYCQTDLKQNYNINKIRFYPRDGRLNNKPASEHVKRLAGGKFYGSLNGTDWTEIYAIPAEISSAVGETAICWYEFGVNADYRYIKYENKANPANIAEIEIYGVALGTVTNPTEPEPDPNPTPTEPDVPDGFVLLSRDGWGAETNSAQDSAPNKTGAEMVLDGNVGTLWHSKYDPASAGSDKDANPIYLTVDMKEEREVSMIRYTPREKGSTAGSVNGVITAYEVYVSSDNTNWTKIAEGDFGYKLTDTVQAPKNIVFAPVYARYLKLVAKDNLSNGATYMASCAEFNAYKYEGEMSVHPITAAREKLNTIIDGLNAVTSDNEVKTKLLEKANELKTAGSVDGIENFTDTASSVTDALNWISQGIDDVYISRLMSHLADNNISASAIASVNAELNGFYTTGAEAAQTRESIWQTEFSMSEAEKSQPLYERIAGAVQRAKARIDSNDGKDYKMLKELVSYISGKNQYDGYENPYGMNASACEAVVNNINYAIANLEKMDKGELSTELTTYKSGERWLDTLGSKISAHGGQIIKCGDTYYWYGEDNKIEYALKTGVSCYSSKDLKNWTYEGLAFKVFDDGTEEKQFTKEFLTDSLLGTQGRIERPKVIYNEKTDKYVMWMHLEKNGAYDLSAMGVAVSDSPTGPFKWLWHGRPVCDRYAVNGSYHQFFRDMNLFVDEDSKEAYLFVSSENNQVMYAIRLNDDYTWIDADDLESSGTTEADIAPGKVITPDMRAAEDRNGGYKGASYTYGKKSFTRYQLASGGAAELVKKKNEDGSDAKDENGNQIYVSGRPDGKLAIPEYSDGRWARVGQNAAEVNKNTDSTETIVNNDITTRREAPAPIKIEGKYYLVTSSLSGWKANPSLCQTADSILGTWTSTGNPMAGTGPSNNGQWSQAADIQSSFNSQSTCIVQMPNGEYMYMGDRWKNGCYVSSDTIADVDVKASTYVWLPITFENGVMRVYWHDSWSYDGAEEPDPKPIVIKEKTVTAAASAQVRASDGNWTAINAGSTKLIDGTNAIEINGKTFMGALYSFDTLGLPDGAKLISAVLTAERAGDFKQIYYTVLRTSAPSGTSSQNIFDVVSAAVAGGTASVVGKTKDAAAASGDYKGTVTIDVTDAINTTGNNSYFLYLPDRPTDGNKRSLKAGASLTVKYEIAE